MSDFVSRPPSEKAPPLANLFPGGLQPAVRDVAALIVVDIRSLNLSADVGRELEASIREFIFEQLESHADLSDRSAIDLSSSVFGIAIE